MSEEKQDSALEKPSIISILPRDVHLVISQYFSLQVLGKLRLVSKFFLEVAYNVTFFSERTKDLLLSIFYTEEEAKPLTKKFLRDQIDKADEKIDLSGADIGRISAAAFPKKNIVLKNAIFGPDIPSYPFTLLNKIALKIHDEAINEKIPTVFPSPRGGAEFDCGIYRENGITINTSEFDFLEHCLLYRFNVLPTKAEAKNSLKCFYFYQDIPGKRTSILILGIGCSDQTVLKEMKTKLEKLKSRVALSSDCHFKTLEEIYGKEGNFTIAFPFGDAVLLFLTNPIHLALRLLNNPEYLVEEDFGESCEFLLTEIEKFRGFSSLGISDEALNKLKGRLESAIKYAIEGRKHFPPILKKVEEIVKQNPVDSYSQINRTINDFQQEIAKTPDVGEKDYLQKTCMEIRFKAAIDTIEAKLKNNSDNKAACQTEFKKVINSGELTIAQKAGLFAHFKDRVELNRHRNPQLDDFFGIKNTTSWRETWKEVRDDAKQKLFTEVDHLSTPKEKQEALNWARSQPLFCDHRNNTILKGAFGRTQAMIDIDEKMQRLG